MFTGRLEAGTFVTSRPSRRTRPTEGSSKPAIMRKVVVLPHPDGPSIVKNSPLRIVRSRSRTTGLSPNRFVTESRTMCPSGVSNAIPSYWFDAAKAVLLVVAHAIARAVRHVSPRPSLAEERKPQILRAAARVIGERGIEGTRLVDVAREAGLSVGAVQHYFGTRDRLLSAAFAFESERAAERWQAAADGAPDAWAKLIGLVGSAVDPERSRTRWARWLEFWAASARDPALRPEMRLAYEYWRAPIRKAIEEGVDEGLFRPAGSLDAVVDRVVATFDGLALQVLLDGMPLEHMRDMLVERPRSRARCRRGRLRCPAKSQKRPSPDARGHERLTAPRCVVRHVGERIREQAVPPHRGRPRASRAGTTRRRSARSRPPERVRAVPRRARRRARRSTSRSDESPPSSRSDGRSGRSSSRPARRRRSGAPAGTRARPARPSAPARRRRPGRPTRPAARR